MEVPYSIPEAEGRTAERPVSLELIPPDGSPGFQINYGARIRGGVSSQPFNSKLGFRFLFVKNRVPDIWPIPSLAQRGSSLLIRSTSAVNKIIPGICEDDPHCLFVRNQFARDLHATMGRPAAKGDFVLLDLNGHFWGLFDT